MQMPNTQPTAAVINKTIGVPLNKEATSRTAMSTLIVRGYFTSDKTDMHGDIITRGATERAIEQYRQWGNIRRMHAPDPVGKVRGIGEADGLEWNEVEIEVIDPKAIFEVENELLMALSIGAMILWDDITWMEDGGMLINDYLLGEISLVDHPANYDSYLRDENSAKTAVDMLVRQYGIDVVSKGMLNILEENDMAETANTSVELDVTENETEEVTEATVEGTEEADVEATKEITEETEDTVEDTEEAVEDETIEEEAVEETDESGAEDDETLEASIDETEEEDSVEDRLTNIENMLTTLVERSVVTETEEVAESVEDQDTDEATAGDDTEEVDEDAHKAVVPATEDVETEETTEEQPRKTLHAALMARFSQN
jgi:hypothetical protein